MRQLLISALLLSLVSACSSVNIGPHRIDVQQGNALNQENVSRLKTGLNRSQVRFLLGTPLVVDPFRTDRWDYVYIYYKAGKLAEQKRISLFFDGDTLARIEGDWPVAEPVASPPAIEAKREPKSEPKAEKPVVSALPAAVSQALPAPVVPKAEPIPVAKPVEPQPVVEAAPAKAAARAAAPAPVAKPVAASQPQPQSQPQPARLSGAATSIVPPLPSPKNVPAYVDPRTSAELSLQPETNVALIKPDAIPPFPEPAAVAARNDETVLHALNAWADAWARRNEKAYLAAYDASFVPQGGDSRAEWENRKRLLLRTAKNIDLKIDSASVERTEEGAVTVTFNQHYRSDSYRDAVVKQLLMIERDGRWLIIEEKVLSTLGGAKR